MQESGESFTETVEYRIVEKSQSFIVTRHVRGRSNTSWHWYEKPSTEIAVTITEGAAQAAARLLGL